MSVYLCVCLVAGWLAGSLIRWLAVVVPVVMLVVATLIGNKHLTAAS